MTSAARRGRVNVPMVAAGVATLVCLALVAGHGAFWEVPGLGTLERNSVDARFRLRGPRPPADDRIVIVGIDDETRRLHPEVIQTRRGWAALLDRLAALGPKVIALDLFYSSEEILLERELEAEVARVHGELVAAGPALSAEAARARETLGKVVEETRGDEVLTAAIERAGNVYLGIVFHLQERGDELEASAPEQPGTERARFGDSAVAGGPNQPLRAVAVTATVPEIGRGAVGAGTTNVLLDPDGVTRRAPLVIQHGDRHYFPLGVAVALAERGTPQDASYVGGRDTATIAGRTVPLGQNATALLDFLGPARTFPRVSAAAVLDGTAPREALAGKLVIVGLTYGSYDKVATPYDQLFDGVEVHATLAHNLLHGELFRPGGRGLTLVAIALLGAAVTVLQLRRLRRRAWVPVVGVAALLLAWLGYAHLRFGGHVLVELVAPLASVALVALAAGITALATEGREKARLRTAFSQYVSGTVVERILAAPEAAHLGGERRELTVLFSDIRGFSGLAEALEPERLASFLNEYLTPMTQIVLDSDGTLDKYIGDAVMAIWGAPVDVPDHPARACAAALAMQERLGAMNVAWRAARLPEVAIGVGINTGAMAVGNMGSEARFDYTVLGDAVNLAARLEGLTKEYAVDILVGEGTAQAAGAGFVFRELDWVRVKGREGTAAVFELLGRRGDARWTDADLAAWADGLAAYRGRDFARAVERWGDLALRHPDDGAAAVMRARAERLRAAPPPDDWDGVYEQRSK